MLKPYSISPCDFGCIVSNILTFNILGFALFGVYRVLKGNVYIEVIRSLGQILLLDFLIKTNPGSLFADEYLCFKG